MVYEITSFEDEERKKIDEAYEARLKAKRKADIEEAILNDQKWRDEHPEDDF